MRTMLVEECILKFDNEKAFVVKSEHFAFLNNVLEKIDTDALEVEASETIRIVGNSFEHAQEKVFVDIRPTLETTSVEFLDNTFHQFEDGFLQLSSSLSSGRLLEISRIDLLTKCHCWLAHEAITKDREKSHVKYTEGHVAFEKLIQRGIR